MENKQTDGLADGHKAKTGPQRSQGDLTGVSGCLESNNALEVAEWTAQLPRAPATEPALWQESTGMRPYPGPWETSPRPPQGCSEQAKEEQTAWERLQVHVDAPH